MKTDVNTIAPFIMLKIIFVIVQTSMTCVNNFNSELVNRDILFYGDVVNRCETQVISWKQQIFTERSGQNRTPFILFL